MIDNQTPHGILGLGSLGFDQVCDQIIESGTPTEIVTLLKEIESLSPQSRMLARAAVAALLGLAQHKPMEYPEVDSDDFIGPWQVITLHDPAYSPALDALIQDGDAKPLAKLFKMGIPMPGWVGQRLGIMLAPSKEYRGFKLEVKTNTGKDWRSLLQTLVEKRDAGNILRELLARGEKYESAVAEVRSQTGKGRTWVESCRRVDNDYIVDASQGLLGFNDKDVER